MHLNLCHVSQPMGGVSAKPLLSASLTDTNPKNTNKYNPPIYNKMEIIYICANIKPRSLFIFIIFNDITDERRNDH